jgi:hypothetical protein
MIGSYDARLPALSSPSAREATLLHIELLSTNCLAGFLPRIENSSFRQEFEVP